MYAPPPNDAPRSPPPPVAANAAWRLASTLTRLALSFVSVPLLTRTLGLEQWGLLALFQAVSSPLAVMEMGLSASTVKNAAESLGRGDVHGAARAIHAAALLHTALGTGLALLIALAAPAIAGSVFAIPPDQVGATTAGFRIVALQIWAAFAGGTWMAVHTAMQRYDRFTKVGLAVTGAATLAGVGAALTSARITDVVLAQALAAGVGAVAWYRSATGLLPAVRGLPRWDSVALMRNVRVGRVTAIAAVSTIVSGWIDRYTLGVNFLPAVVGFYAIAQMLQSQIYGMFGEMGEVLFPAVSHRHGSGDLPGARHLALLAGWAMTVGFGSAAVVLAVVGGDFIALWVSPQAAASATLVLRLLCAGGAIGMATVAPLYYLLGSGRDRPYAVATSLTAAAIGVVSIVAVPRLGLPGAGLGLMVGVAVRTAIVGFAWRSTAPGGEPLGDFFIHLWPAPILSVTMIAAFSPLHDALFRASTWPALAAEAVTVAGVAVALMAGVAWLLPGGRLRFAEVLASFRPVALRVFGAGAGRT